MNTNAVSRSLAVASVLLAAPALAEQYGPLEVVGFLKNEYSLCDNCSAGLVNRSAYDPRGVLSPPVPMVNQGGDSEGTRTQSVPRATDARPVARVRQRREDRGEDQRAHAQHGRGHLRQLDDGPLRGRVAPDLRLAAGRQDDLALVDALRRLRLSRWACRAPGPNRAPATACSRRPCATRTREFEIPIGKIRFEATYARGGHAQARSTRRRWWTSRPIRSLYEIFIQYSNEKNLVELIYQDSERWPAELVLQGRVLRGAGQHQRPGLLARSTRRRPRTC